MHKNITIIDNDRDICNSEEVANTFNDYYTSRVQNVLNTRLRYRLNMTVLRSILLLIFTLMICIYTLAMLSQTFFAYDTSIFLSNQNLNNIKLNRL